MEYFERHFLGAKLFASGLPLYVMPLDSTQVQLDEVERAILFRSGTPLTDALTTNGDGRLQHSTM